MTTVDELQQQIDAAEQAHAQRLKLLRDAQRDVQRALEQSELYQQQQAERERVAAEKQAKIDSWRETGLKQAATQLNAIQSDFDAWRADLEQWAAAGRALAERQRTMNTAIVAIAQPLAQSALSHDWRETFESDTDLQRWIGEQVRTLPRVTTAIQLDVAFELPKSTDDVVTAVMGEVNKTIQFNQTTGNSLVAADSAARRKMWEASVNRRW